MAVPIHRFQRSATTAEAACELIDRLGARSRFVGAAQAGAGRLTLGHATVGELSAGRLINVGMRLALAVEPPADQLAVATFLSGRMRLVPGRLDEVTCAAGDSFLCPTDGPMLASWDDFDVVGLRLPMAQLHESAPGLIDFDETVPLRFCGTGPVSADRAAVWRTVALLAFQEMWAPDSMLTNPLVRREMIDTVIAAALTTFPNTAMTCGYVPQPGAVQPRAMRRAVAFIDANASLPITVADIAAAAGTSTSAVRAAFRRHLDTTPTAHLRRVRLLAAHRDLQAADPTSDTTVAEIAGRWGFRRREQFDNAYRECFGVPAEQTLRR
ncbi:MAG TPA: AraC family transcriptional regulator [Sporichthyaceae bacterium]|jgi:AraC-like DNA-binding protein|nr:AraC family transcriptional regulator [Sporichthyaceae bacterium]